MILKRFCAESFRNIDSCDIEFSPGVNLLYGRNAEGKTNVIEGIYIFSRGKSFRRADDSDLVKFGGQGFRISIEYSDKSGDGTLEYAYFGKERLRKKNGYKLNKVAEMIGSFKSVIFYPDNLSLVKDGPDARREFLNVAIAQCYPSYMKYYASYKSALENRNCLLKFIQRGFFVDRAELESWSKSMAEYASYIYLLREQYSEVLSRHAKRILSDISESREELVIRYDSSISEKLSEREDVKREYERIFSENIDKEISQGTSLYGPHRDDLKIYLNGKEARSFASQGQQRSIVLAMKLAEGEVIREIFGEYPVFLFDDVLSELDDKRRAYVLSGVGERQFIITSCSRSECEGFSQNEIDVSGGHYVRSHR